MPIKTKVLESFASHLPEILGGGVRAAGEIQRAWPALRHLRRAPKSFIPRRLEGITPHDIGGYSLTNFKFNVGKFGQKPEYMHINIGRDPSGKGLFNFTDPEVIRKSLPKPANRLVRGIKGAAKTGLGVVGLGAASILSGQAAAASGGFNP